jgi:hypothetical protein
LYEIVAEVERSTERRRRTFCAPFNDTPPSPRTLNPNVPAALGNLVMRLLAKDRNARPQRAAVVRSGSQQLARALESGAHPGRRWFRGGALAAAVIVAALAIWITRRPSTGVPVEREYTQITHFADSATSPALSSDGRLLAFIRGPSTFNGRGHIYVKALPDGEPLQLTSDAVVKMSPVFSPDHSMIAYTVVKSEFVWDTWVVPVHGGAPRPWLQNASGLSWLRGGRLLFSEMTVGLHMQVVTGADQREGIRLLYSPPDAPGAEGMAHRSAVSPDGAWVIIAEMSRPVGQPCRLVPASGQSAGRPVGPDGGCTSAAWSPDGKWMSFSSNSMARTTSGVSNSPTAKGHEEKVAVAAYRPSHR